MAASLDAFRSIKHILKANAETIFEESEGQKLPVSIELSILLNRFIYEPR